MNNVTLIGMPGSGKSTIGVILAKALRYEFLDSDLLIQKQEKRKLSEIIEQDGPERFKEIENQVNADEFVDRKIISVEKETILNGAGINLEIYECKPYPKSDPPHFLYLGRIMKEKGMDELFSAAEKLHDDGYKFVLDLVGFFEDEYKERVELLESKGVVKFHGFQEEPRPYYATADCVVMPSYHEGMSNVNLEASATGRPVITTDIPGCRESVENEYTGWLCEPKSVDSLYEKMKAFLETDISKREVMGKYARQKMVDEFDKKIVVNDTVKALKL